MNDIARAALVARCPAPHEFHPFIIAVLKRVQGLDLARYEEPDSDLSELLSVVGVILQVSTEILTLVVAHYEAVDGRGQAVKTEDPSSRDSHFLVEVDRRMSRMVGASDIADLAFVARLGLRGRLETVRQLMPISDRWEVVGACGSASRETMKSMSALEAAISRHEGLQSENTTFATELSRSLETRRTYAAFRRDLASTEPLTFDDVTRRLRLSAIAIAKLVGRNIYPDLRLNDRKQLREIQARILEWLRSSDSSSKNTRAGVRLWQDLAGFAELLIAINNRAELRTNDKVQLERAIALCATIDASDAGDPRTEALFGELTPLYGRDPEIDAFIHGPGLLHDDDARRLLKGHLERVLARVTEGDAPASVEPSIRQENVLNDADFF